MFIVILNATVTDFCIISDRLCLCKQYTLLLHWKCH